MKRILPIIILVIFAAGCVKDRSFAVNPYVTPGIPTLGSRTIVHYWNFNGTNILIPTQTTGGAGLFYTGGGLYDAVSPGSTINARNGDIDGSGLRLRNPAGIFTLNLPTTNYRDIIFSFAVQRSNNGAQNNIIAYTIDGTNYITDGVQPNIVQLDTAWKGYSLDFTAIVGVNDNPNFKIQIRYAVSDTGISGNDRYDNIAIDGNIITPVGPVPPTIMHYWNFNNTATVADATTPSFTIGGASLNYVGTWDSYSVGSLINARNGDSAGAALRLRNPAGTFTITAPTNNYKNIKLTMEVQHSSSGAQTNTITYTVDGTNYISTGIANNSYSPGLDPAYFFVSYDFSGIPGIDNNPNFKINIDFSNGSTGTSGNDRFDNIVLEGVHL
jgi:3,4-dihydroxy-2-butanone 4-phosphate synthase